MNSKTRSILLILFIIGSISLLIFGYNQGLFESYSSESETKYYKRINLDVGDTSILDSKIINDKVSKIESSDNNVATVDENGRIEAKAKGIAIITIKSEDNKVVKKIEVVVKKDNNSQQNTKEQDVINIPVDDENREEENQ